MNQDQFNQNISQWVNAINESIKILNDNQNDLNSALEEDLETINYQRIIIDQLKQQVDYQGKIIGQLMLQLNGLTISLKTKYNGGDEYGTKNK